MQMNAPPPPPLPPPRVPPPASIELRTDLDDYVAGLDPSSRGRILYVGVLGRHDLQTSDFQITVQIKQWHPKQPQSGGSRSRSRLRGGGGHRFRNGQGEDVQLGALAGAR
jgi:hypothetical protein